MAEPLVRLASSFLGPGIHVLYIFFIFQTDVLQQIRIGRVNLAHRDGPRLGVNLGIIDCDLDLQMSEVRTPEPTA